MVDIQSSRLGLMGLEPSPNLQHWLYNSIMNPTPKTKPTQMNRNFPRHRQALLCTSAQVGRRRPSLSSDVAERSSSLKWPSSKLDTPTAVEAVSLSWRRAELGA